MKDTTHSQDDEARGGDAPQAEERTTAEQRQRIQAWFAGRLTENWFEGPATVVVDDDEIFVSGQLPAVTLPRVLTPISRRPRSRPVSVGSGRNPDPAHAHRRRGAVVLRPACLVGASCGSTSYSSPR